MTEIDMARQYGHNMEVEFIDNKDAFNIGYKAFLAGYKANEWHFVKDESYTKSWKKYNKYLVIIRLPVKVGNSDIPLLAYFDHYHQKWSVDRKCLSAYNVIAWKEIVLPKEIELNSF